MDIDFFFFLFKRSVVDFLRTTGDERFFPETAPQVSDCAFGEAERREPDEALVGSDGVAEERVEAHA